jgi:TrpR family trp operon transcriptional repressor
MKDSNDEGGWWRFLELCLEIESTQQLDSFFDLFLTLEEKKDLTNRYLIVQELLKGELTQREIASELQVSIANITRGSNGIKRIGDDLRNFLIERLK